MKKQVFLLFAAMLFSQAAFAQSNYSFSAVAPSGQILFYLNNGDGTVSVVAPTSNWSGYEKPTGNLIIPDIVENYGVYNVTSIGNLAFSGCIGLTSVTIPNSVTQIGSHAFNNCTGLTSVTIGNSVTSIGADAFSLCHGLTSVNYTGTVDQWHSINFDYGVLFGTNPIAFSHNLYLNNVLLTDLVFSDTTTNINDNFSFDTALTTITIPNSVTRIGDLAFYSCSGLTSVTIPNSVTQIGGGAFCECTGLTSVTIPNSVTQIEGSIFYGCTGLTSITIPNSVTQIGSAAFSGCTGLISVTIPNSVTSIGDEAFNGCTGLTSVTIPNSVDSIGNHAFFGCTGLTSVTIGNSVTSIGYCAFSFCSGLTSMRFLCQVPPQLGSFVFEDVPTDIPVFIPCGTRTYYVAQLPYFTNYMEQPYEFSAETADESTGTVQVLTAPSCTDHNAVLYAMSADGYHFDHWSTGSTDNPYTMTVTSDTTIIAYFVSNGGGTEGIGEVGENDIHISVFNGRISVEGITNEEVRVYDITGRTVQNRSLPSGVYIVKVGTLPAQKVVVMR